MTLTADRVRELLIYEPETGILRFRHKRGSRAAGGVAGSFDKKDGYWNIRVDKKLYRAHRVIWLMVNGEWPHQIDHKNRDRSDNRWENLRATCDALNLQNIEKARKDSVSGLKGVRVDARKAGRFWASIKVGGKAFYLGAYECPVKAHRAYLDAKSQLHPAWYPTAEALNQVVRTENHLLNERGGRRTRSDSKSGITGVIRRGDKWISKANCKHVGMFSTAESAHAAYLAAKAASRDRQPPAASK